MRKIAMLRALQAFEATARYGNYVDAASELSVTPAAVGQQVRALEAWLGTPLFKRVSSGQNRLTLTEAASAALPEFAEGFDRLNAGLRRIRIHAARKMITVSVSQAFVARWLLPRLDDFTRRNPDIDVRLDVTDRLTDIEHGEADIGIRCGSGTWTGLQSIKLMTRKFSRCVLMPCSTGNARPKQSMILASSL